MKLYYLLIPILIGIGTGAILVITPMDNYDDSKTLTASKLIENGSPVMGNPDAKNYNFRMGGLSMYILLQVSSKYSKYSQ